MVLALLPVPAAASADSPASAIQILDFDRVQPSSRDDGNDCWTEHPMGAKVFCAAEPEHGSLTARVRVDSAPSEDIAVDYESMDLTATAGSDYTALDGTVTIKAGERSATFDIQFIDDRVEEGNEAFVIELTTTSEEDLDYSHIHVTIIDEESIKFTVEDSSAVEGQQGGMPVRVLFSDTVTWPYRIGIETRTGTAGDNDFYGLSYRLLVDPHGQPAVGFSLGHRLFDDSIDEPDETYSLIITGEDYLSTGSDSGTMTIIDDDDPPSARVADASGLEDAVGKLSFEVKLSSESGHEIKLDYATSDDTATAGSDYTSNSGTLTFEAGDTEMTVEVSVTADDVYEDEEKFNVTLSNGSHVTFADSTAVGTIENDDAGLSVADASASEADGELEFVITADGLVKADETVSVNYVTEHNTAKARDYNPTAGLLTLTSTTTERTISVTVREDDIDEPDETMFLNLVNPTNATLVDGQAVGTILDNDVASTQITLGASPARVEEGDGETDIVVTATLDGGARTDATDVTVSVAGSGNADAVDFAEVQDFTITIAAGQKSGTGTFTLTPVEDGVDESDETLTVTGSSDLPVTGTEVVLADDDVTSSRIALTAAPPRVSESDGSTNVQVTAALDGSPRTRDTTVTVSVSGSGNADAVDFASVQDFTITIATGETSGSGTFQLNPEDDNVDEADETISVEGSSDLPVTGATVVLADDDATSSSIALTAEPPRVSEGDGSTMVELTVTLDGGARTEATDVAVSVSGSGDANAVDFASVQDFTITIPMGHTSGSGTFQLIPEDDNVDEADERIMIQGTADLSESLRVVTVITLVLADDDEPSSEVLLSASPARVPEDGGATAVEVTATLDASARTESTTVTVSVSGSGDSAAVDYDLSDTAFDIVIAEGATTGIGTFTVTPEDDEVDEQDEVIHIAGTSDLSVTATSVTLTDDDPTSMEILLSAAPSTVSEGAGETSVEVTATLDAGARTEETLVEVSVSGSGNEDAVDFAAVQDFTITIDAGSTSGRATFDLSPEDDNVEESSETLTLSGTADIQVTGTSVTLTDNDVASDRISLSASPARASEGGGAVPVRVTAALNGAARQAATTVTVSVAGSADPEAVDFQPVDDFTITIEANDTSGEGTFTLTPEDDDRVESDETLTVSGTSDLPVDSATVTLADDDEASTRILLSASPGRVSEGGGPTPVTVTATLDRGLRQVATTVTVSVSGSGDPAASDFASVQDFAITIPANAASGTGRFTLTPEDDGAAESDETLTVSGTSDLPVESATVTLADDDEASTRILLSASPGRVSEGGGPTPVTVTATLDRGLRQVATTVTVSVSGSGDPAASDFASVQDFAIAIPANAASGTGSFTLTPEDDETVESDERLVISGASDLPVTSTTVTLADDDEVSTRILLYLTLDPPRGSEGDGEIRVTVTAAVDRGVRPDDTRVAVSVSGSGDPDAVDFAPVPDFEVVIPANTPRGTASFTVVPEDDRIVEQDETLTVSGVSDLPVTPATMLLRDDDEASDRIVLTAEPARVSEGDGPVAVTVTASLDRGLRQEATTVTVSVSGSGDPVAVDFAPVPDFSITIEANASSGMGMFTLTPEDDAEDESDETLTLSGASDLPVAPASVVIEDNDEVASRVLSILNAEAVEGSGEVAFEVTLDGPSPAEVTVRYATVDPVGSADPVAAAGVDYDSVSGTLMFAPGEISQTIRVAVLDDALDEPDETFAVALSDLRGAILGRGSALGTIRDDDEPPALTVADAAGDEDIGALEFEVNLSAPSGIEVSASYATADGTATAGSDYTAAMGTLVFAPGEVSKAIRVAILDDNQHEADEETFELSLSGLVNATAADDTATGTIRDDDLAPPTIAGELPAALLCVGGAPLELDLADYFGGDELRFSAVPSAPEVATAELKGSRLTVAPVSEGESSVVVTAANDAGSAESSMRVRVATDPAELEAVDSALASIGRAVLTSLTGSVHARFAEPVTSRTASGADSQAPDAHVVVGTQWDDTLTLIQGNGSREWDARGLFEPEDRIGDWFDAMNHTQRRAMSPFAFSLDSAQSASTGPAWSVWGRGDTHRFESGIDGNSDDGTLTAVHLGTDARFGDWLAGVSVSRSGAEADYRFDRSVDACGGGGVGEGMIEADLTSAHPYAGRRIGDGWVWAAVGAGSGEVTVERCETGQRREADLSVRLGALGGRHLFASSERIALSIMEEIGVLDLTTGDAPGPIGDRSVRVGQARLGLEASGVVPAGCECSLSSYVRAFARGDWGDGATGAGLELAAGVRFRNLPRRIGIDAGIRALAAHSAEGARDQSANVTFSLLPKSNGTGWQASMKWRQGANAGLDMMNGFTPWTPPSGRLPGAERRWIAESRLGYGVMGRRGVATPFVEFDAGRSERVGARFGVRHEFGDHSRGLVVEWSIEQTAVALHALGRF